MRDRNEIITSQIPRGELLGLLDTMAPGDSQKVTAEHEVPVLHLADLARPSTAEPTGTPTMAKATKKKRDTTGNLDVVVRFAPSSTGSHPAVTIPSQAPVARGARITDAIRAISPADVAEILSTETAAPAPPTPVDVAPAAASGDADAPTLPTSGDETLRPTVQMSPLDASRLIRDVSRSSDAHAPRTVRRPATITGQIAALDSARPTGRDPAHATGTHRVLDASRITGPHQPLALAPAPSRTSSVDAPVLLPAPSALIAASDRRPLPHWVIVAVSAGVTLFLALLIALIA